MIDDTLYDAFGQRQVSTIFTQLNQYHVVLESQSAMAAGRRESSRHLRANSSGTAGPVEFVHAR